jgi:hypothetical protein
VSLLLAACGTPDTDEQPVNMADDLVYNSIDNRATMPSPSDNAFPAATIPEETMPPVLPNPVDTQELNDDAPANDAGNAMANNR